MPLVFDVKILPVLIVSTHILQQKKTKLSPLTLENGMNAKQLHYY